MQNMNLCISTGIRLQFSLVKMSFSTTLKIQYKENKMDVKY